MSVITTVEATPSRLRLFFTSMIGGRPLASHRDKLAALMAPLPLRRGGADGEEGGSANVFSNSMREAVALGIIKLDDGDQIRPGALLPSHLGEDADATFQAWIEPRLLSQNEAAEAQQPNVPAAFAWLLLQDPFRPIPFSVELRNLLAAQFEEASPFDLSVKERFQNLVYWAHYLGLASLGPGRAVIADPTRAIERHLTAMFGGKPEVPIDHACRVLADALPCLDGGASRSMVEGQLKNLPAPESHQRLSRSFSLALKRLEYRKVISFRDLSDAQIRILDLGDEKLQRVSHLVATPGAA